MIKIDGFKQLDKQLKDAQKILDDLDGELGTVSFDPNDPSSIEMAIQEVESMIDDRVGVYSSNAIIGPLAEQMKEQYREAILEKATAARLGEGPE